MDERNGMANRSLSTSRASGLTTIAFGLLLAALLPNSALAQAGDLETLRTLYTTGKYDECITKADGFIKANNYGESYRLFKAKAELARGKYANAVKTIEEGIGSYSWSISLRWLGYRAYLHTDKTARAADMIGEIDKLYEKQQWRYSDAEDLVVLGEVALLIGADAKAVLGNFFDRAKKNSPTERYGYVAAGNMALDKNDDQLALNTFISAARKFPRDTDVLFGLARALADSDPERSGNLFKQILEINPKHVPTILLQTDRLISSESYKQAEKNIDIVLKVNPVEPEAWALRAVIAHLQSDAKREKESRQKALSTWKQNPEVDHLIGAKLSRSYRFAEGSAYQKSALKFDPTYLPAQIQLSQDLLRLGREDEGWKLAEAAHEADGYDTTTFNLLNLRDHMRKFRTIENEHFVLRMSEREAAIYGARAMRLLERARTVLCEKYGLELDEKVTVEIFPQESDFAVRTFGMPAVSGFLGVCFGKVITANSPASQLDSPNNWESVLWHEFCHVVTLSLTNNKMPRWLSEGISVYEEQLANPSWGMGMTPQYREWILGDEMLPVRDMTKAFMQPPTPMHVQFAYFQSSLVVEYIVQEHGVEALTNILKDLGNGVLINEALNRRTNSLEELEEGFVKFARQRANDLAPDVDWESPEKSTLLDPNAAAAYLVLNPNNYIALTASATQLLRAKQWAAAEEALKRLIELYPEDISPTNARKMLISVYRAQERTEDEIKLLEEYVAVASDAASSCERLAKLHAAANDWPSVLSATDKLFAINPLMKAPWKLRAEACESTGSADSAIEAWRALLALEPEDPALANFRLAKLLHAKNDPAAKRHALMALEEAPRYREAHKLLLEIVTGSDEPSRGTPRASAAGAAETPAGAGAEEKAADPEPPGEAKRGKTRAK